MSDITKPVNMSTAPQERMQVFNQGDASQGDVLLIVPSIGKAARQIAITPVNAMTIRTNVYQTVYPKRQGNDLMFTSQMNNLALGQKVKDESSTPLPIAAGTTFILDIPVEDIELVSVSGNWTIVVI